MSNEIIDLKDVLVRVQNDKELLFEILGIFLEDCPTKIQSIKEAVAKKDFNVIREAAHSMKGASANISAKKINPIFLQIEQMAKNNSLDGIEELLEKLNGAFEELKDYSAKIKTNFPKVG